MNDIDGGILKEAMRQVNFSVDTTGDDFNGAAAAHMVDHMLDGLNDNQSFSRVNYMAAMIIKLNAQRQTNIKNDNPDDNEYVIESLADIFSAKIFKSLGDLNAGEA